MLLAGTLMMGFWLMLVGGLQGKFGDWGLVGNDRRHPFPLLFLNTILTSSYRYLAHHRSR